MWLPRSYKVNQLFILLQIIATLIQTKTYFISEVRGAITIYIHSRDSPYSLVTPQIILCTF